MVHMKSQNTRNHLIHRKTTAHNLLQHQHTSYHSNNDYINSIYVTITTVTMANNIPQRL